MPARTTKIVFHVYDRRTGSNFQDFVLYYNSSNSYDLNKFIEFQSNEISMLGFSVTGYDYETRYTNADLREAFETSGYFCAEPGFTKMPDMPRWGTQMSDPQQD